MPKIDIETASSRVGSSYLDIDMKIDAKTAPRKFVRKDGSSF